MTTKCPNGGCDVCALGGDCRDYPPAPVSPKDTLDFEKAEAAGDAAWDAADPIEGPIAGRMEATEAYRAALNAQVAEIVQRAREEERADLLAEVQRLRGERESGVRTLADSLAAYGEPVPKDATVFALAICLDQFASRTERALATLRASHAEVVKAIREWQRCRDGCASIESEEFITYDADRHRRAEAAYRAAEDALAAFDLGKEGV